MPTSTERAGGSKDSLAWVDSVKGLALAWIVLNHVVERFYGSAYAGNPNDRWPPLAARVAQFDAVGDAGVLGGVFTFVRDLGWFGDQGVTVFIILSGFGLTYGLLSRNAGPVLGMTFYRRRSARIYPMYWGAHILFLALAFAGIGALSIRSWRFYASIAGLRFLPSVFYYFSPAWWYVGLVIQLYLVFPLLWRLLKKRGAATVLIGGCAAGFAALAAGPHLFHNAYLDAWQRGAFFITRLPEFTFGIALAAAWHARPDTVATSLRRPLILACGLATYAGGTVLSFTLAGMIVAPFLLGTSAFVLLFALVSKHAKPAALTARVGRAAYPLYLTHHPFVLALVPTTLGAGRAAEGIVLALAASAASAYVLSRGVERIGIISTRWESIARSRGAAAASRRVPPPLPPKT